VLNAQLQEQLDTVLCQLDRLTEQQDSSTSTNDLRIKRIMEEANSQTRRAEERVTVKEGEVERLSEVIETLKGQMAKISDGANDYQNQFESMKLEFDKVRGGEERRLERSESKSITPPSYITNILPLVASLITGLWRLSDA